MYLLHMCITSWRRTLSGFRPQENVLVFLFKVCTKEEQEILQRDSNKSQKLRKKLMGGSSQIYQKLHKDSAISEMKCV